MALVVQFRGRLGGCVRAVGLNGTGFLRVPCYRTNHNIG